MPTSHTVYIEAAANPALPLLSYDEGAGHGDIFPQIRQGMAPAGILAPFASAWTRSLAILCACMILFAATLRLAHSHSIAEQESGHCQICSSIHTAAPTAIAPVPIILHAGAEPIVTRIPDSPAILRVATLSDRDPPNSPYFQS